MGRYRSWNDVLVMPCDLIEFAWSAPMRELAGLLEMSDVGLKKNLHSRGVVTPPRGYWNKLRAGKTVPTAPAPEERRPGELGRVSINKRFLKVVPIAQPMSSTGPFKSAHVPESLDKLYALELQSIGKFPAQTSPKHPHASLQKILKQDADRQTQYTKSGSSWDAPLLNNPIAQRQLGILSRIFLTLAHRGYDGELFEREGRISARALIGDTPVRIEVVRADGRSIEHAPSCPRLSPSIPLAVDVSMPYDRRVAEDWKDDARGKVEIKLPSIAAGIITTGEAIFRRKLKDREQHDQEQRNRIEQQQQIAIDNANRERVQNLHMSGELLRRSSEIRSLVQCVRKHIQMEGVASNDELHNWEQWALAEADKIDPILSGQFLTHLRPPGNEF